MKKTIRFNGKRHTCDTDTAVAIAHRNYGDFGDPAGYEETLFRNRNGFYFILGCGGNLSPYSEDGKIVGITEQEIENNWPEVA